MFSAADSSDKSLSYRKQGDDKNLEAFDVTVYEFPETKGANAVQLAGPSSCTEVYDLINVRQLDRVAWVL